jgi:hypothetical protein
MIFVYRVSGDAHEVKDKDGAKDRLLRHRRHLFDKHDRLGRSRQDSVRGNSGLRCQIDTVQMFIETSRQSWHAPITYA